MTITLPVTKRDDTEKTATLRAKGKVPAVVYGPKQAPLAVVAEEKVLSKVLKAAGESTVIELSGLGEPVEVLVKEVSFSPVKQELEHVDLYAVERGKEMTTQIHLEYLGVAPAETDNLGVVNKVLHEVSVTCVPASLPSQLEVPLDALKAVGDRVLAKDIALPAGVSLATEPEEVVAVVTEVKEEVDEGPTDVDMNTVEVEQKGKGEETESE